MNKNKLTRYFGIAMIGLSLLVPSIVKAEDEEFKINDCSTSISMTTGQTKKLTVSGAPVDSEVIWEWKKSLEDSTTEITLENGKVTAVKPGGVVVTAKIKDNEEIKATCNINITRNLTDATISSLKITNGTLDRTFSKDVTEYNVTIDSTVTTLKFTDIVLSDPGANFMNPDATKVLKNGDTVRLVVTAQDKKTTKTYTFKIIKDTLNLNLKTLKITGYALNEVFDPEVLEYTASIPYEIDTISLETKADDQNMTVVPSGLSNLKVGTNTVKIVVKDNNGNSRTYTITVTREEENAISENPTSIITSKFNENTSSSLFNNNENNDNTILKYLIVSLACLILFVIGCIGIYFYLKTSPKKLKKEISTLKKANNSHKEETNIEPTKNKVELMETKEFNLDDLNDKDVL